jgi:lysophospholipase L1-like esterase
MQPTKAPWINDAAEEPEDAINGSAGSEKVALPTRGDWAAKAASRLSESTVPPWANKEYPIAAPASALVASAKKLPMEPTKAPWVDGGQGRVFAAPEPGSTAGDGMHLMSDST